MAVDVLEFADGSRQEYVYFKSPRDKPWGVAVAALTKDNNMILTRQYRHPMGKAIYDLPAGGIHKGETPTQAALRELEEETGYTADQLQWIGRFNWNPSKMSGICEIFLAKALRLEGEFDSDEIMNIKLVEFDKVLSRVWKGKYVDSALVIATLLIYTKKLLQ